MVKAKKNFLKIIGILILFVSIIIVLKYNEQKSSMNDDGYDVTMEIILTDGMQSQNINVFSAKDLQISTLAGLCINDDRILICDKGNNCIKEYDLNLAYVESYGKLGLGELEFSNPVDIVQYENKYYVLDAGNNRVQVLDNDMTYVRKIDLPELPDFQGGARYISMEIDSQGVLYLTTNSMIEEANKVYILIKDEFAKTEQSVIGPLINCNGNIYVADMLEYHDYGDSKVAASGYNSLYIIQDGKLKKEIELPIKYAAIDGYYENENIYLLSASQAICTGFSLKENVYDPVFKLPKIGLDAYVAVIPEKKIYVSDCENNKLYQIDLQ